MGEHHGKKAFFFSFIYFLKDERENELQAQKREEVTNVKNRAWISRSDPSNASMECVKDGADWGTCTGLNCSHPFRGMRGAEVLLGGCGSGRIPPPPQDQEG